MTKSMIQDTIYCLNEFPSDNGSSDTIIPDAIVKLLSFPNYDKLILDLVSYAQVHMGTENTTKSRTIGAISLQ